MGYSRCVLAFLVGGFVLVPGSAQAAKRRTIGPAERCRQEERRCPGSQTLCGEPSCGRRADVCLARRQERFGEPGEWIFRHYSFKRFIALNRISFPGSLPRSRLDDALLTRINQIETEAGATLEGYLLDVRRLKGDRASCVPRESEFLELWIGASSRSSKAEAVRGRLTPKALEEHPAWRLGRLKPWRTRRDPNPARIRIRGYLLYNNLRAGEVKTGMRPTAWEISPVTEILICPSTWKCGPTDRDGWLELDTL